ncbi:hypothetical protein BGZ59_003684 [Podila verticillata]|nr:hypothetical protein BGZ59_003684 [Podila verticillata]
MLLQPCNLQIVSTFQDVGSDGSLNSFATSQGSLASSAPSDRSGSTLAMPTATPRENALKQQPRPTSATSAIFGATFERQTQQSALGTSSLVLNGSYFMGPRAPQYIPSPMASPVSPSSDQSLGDNPADDDIPKPKSVKGAASHGSLSAMATELMQEHAQDQLESSAMAIGSDTNDTKQLASSSQEIEFDDTIKVEVAEKSGDAEAEIDQADIAEDDYKVEIIESPLERIGGMAGSALDSKSTGQSVVGSLPLQLLELSFSTNDLTSLWNPSSKSSSLLDLGSSLDRSEKRMRSHTFHSLSDLNLLGGDISNENMAQSNSSLSSSTSTTISESSSSNSFLGASKSQGTFPPKQPSPLKEGHLADQDIAPELEHDAARQSESGLRAGGPDDNRPNLRDHTRGDRKRLSLVTSSIGLAAAAAARSTEDILGDRNPKEKSILDLPSWELAPLSPPLAVKEISGANPNAGASESSSAAASPMNVQRGSIGVRKDSLADDSLMSPASASVMTPTTPLTTREKRILAGREALLRTLPDKQRMSRGTSISSTTSSQPSGQGSTGDHDDSDTLGSQDASRRTSVRSVVQTGGVFGAVPQRGQMKEHVPEHLVFPDQSIRPVPLKAYRVRKMTLKERNQTYAQACQEFTKARTGLDTWALRCMMQDRPALMKDPPAIVKAVAEKFTPGSGSTMNSGQNAFLSQDQRSHTPTSVHSNGTLINSLGGNSISGGIGARIKNAGKRLSMDISGGMPGNYTSHLGISSADLLASSSSASGPSSGNGSGSLFYKQKTTKSAVELGAGPLNRGRAGSVNSGIPPQATPSSTSGHRNSIIGTTGTPTLQRVSTGGPTPNTSPAPSGSGFLSHNKRHSLGATNGSPLSNSLRGRTMSDAPGGSRLLVQRNNTQGSISRQDQLYPPDQGADFITGPHYGGNAGGGPLSPSPSTSSSGSGSMIMERPIKRSTSNHYTRRPASMMVLPNAEEVQKQQGQSTIAGSTLSLGSKSTSSLGSTSSSSMTDLQNSPSTSLKQQEQHQSQTSATAPASTNLALSSYYNAEGGLIPYADDMTSKEVYSPLTSPIMIPLGGFPEPKRTLNQLSSPTNGGWSSPLSAGGLTRPLTYAGQSSYPYSAGSNSSLVMSPSSISRGSAGSGAGPAVAGLGVSGEYTLPGSGPVQYLSPQPHQLSGGYSAPGVQKKPEKAEKSKLSATLNRYSTASSFASIGSFSKNKGSTQKRLSKKEKKREMEELQQQQQQQQQDQRFSVASNSVAPTNDFLVEQSLDKLSDVLPHVDRDRLAIYLQRAYGDEMVAIGLAMSDLRTGML